VDEPGDLSGAAEKPNHGKHSWTLGDPNVPLELTWCIVGDGGLHQPSVSGKVSEGPDAVLYWVQETEVPHVHVLRTRVSFILCISLDSQFV
jgi:hypothetical protein